MAPVSMMTVAIRRQHAQAELRRAAKKPSANPWSEERYGEEREGKGGEGSRGGEEGEERRRVGALCSRWG
jgi:hypothetical protein